MATLKFKGTDELNEKLDRARNCVGGMIKRALYDGAGVLADTLRKETESLPEVKEGFVPKSNQPIRGVTSDQKRGLLSSLFIETMQEDGGRYSTHVFFTGRNQTKTKKYPDGQPNALIARSVNSGSSVRMKIPFVNRAVSKAKAKVEAAMQARLDSDLDKIMK